MGRTSREITGNHQIAENVRKFDKKLFGMVCCIIVGVVILITSYLYSQEQHPAIRAKRMMNYQNSWQLTIRGQSYGNVTPPMQLETAKLGDTMLLKNTLPTDIDNHEYLFFRASHQRVKVYIAKELVYSFGWKEKQLFGKTPACTWVAIPLKEEYQNKNLQIELTGVYPRYAGKINELGIGDMGAVLHEIISKRLGSILICLILIVAGSGMIVVTATLRNGAITASLKRLGLLTILIGCWSVCVTNTLQVVWGNVSFLLNLEFYLFDLLFPVFLWFLLSFQYYRQLKWMNEIFWASIAQFLLIELLQLTGIADYMESIVITHGMVLIGIGYILITGIRDLFRKNASVEVKVVIASVILLILFAGIDLFRFYQVDVVDEGFFTRIGTLIFVILWGYEVVRNMSRRFVNMAKTEALEILAYEDLMTGLNNRTAFEQWMVTYQNSSTNHDVMIVTFDMNGLKQINDTYGHAKGDQAIIIIAHIIKKVFETYGLIYRIGGDEICAILSSKEALNQSFITTKLIEINEAVKAANQELELEFSVAVGYARASKSEDIDIYEAYKAADHRMYEEKLRMKRG